MFTKFIPKSKPKIKKNTKEFKKNALQSYRNNSWVAIQKLKLGLTYDLRISNK